MQYEEPIPKGQEEKAMVTVPNDDHLQHWFTYHAPTDDLIPKYHEIREAGLAFARVIAKNCPDGADKSTAIRTVREAVMWANAAVACCGK